MRPQNLKREKRQRKEEEERGRVHGLAGLDAEDEFVGGRVLEQAGRRRAELDADLRRGSVSDASSACKARGARETERRESARDA